MSGTSRKLGSFERAAVETGRHAAFNAVAVMRLDRTPDRRALRSALDEIQRRKPLLRSRVVGSRGKLFFRADASGPIALEHQLRAADSTWQGCAERELGRGFDVEAGPLARAVLVASEASGPCEVVLSIHHAIVDATGFVALCREILDASLSADADSEAAAPAGSHLQPSPDDLFPAPFRGFRGRGRLAGYLGRQFADEVRWRLAVRGRRQPAAPETATGRVFPMALTREATARLVRRARSERVALVAVLDAALLLSARELLYGEENRPLRYFSFPDLRGSLQPRPEPGSLGAYLTVMRFTAGMKRLGFWQLARDLHRQMHASHRRGDKFLSALAAPMAMRAHRRSGARMGSVAASFSGPADEAGGVAHPALERLHAFVSNLAIGPEVTAQVRIFGGHLLWDFVYLEEDFDRSMMASIAGAIEHRLTYAARPR